MTFYQKYTWSGLWCIRLKVKLELKNSYSDLFSEKLGKFNGFKAKLIVKSDATPKYCKPGRILFELEDSVKLELKRLVDEGVMRSINYSKWTSPIVVVPKTRWASTYMWRL